MRRRSDGFTLVEVLLVAVIIMTVTALAAPRFAGFFAGQQLATSAAGLGTLLRRAHTSAVTEQIRFRLNLAADGERCWLTTELEPFEAPGVFDAPSDGRVSEVRLPVGVRLERVTVDGQERSPGDDELVVVAFDPRETAHDVTLVCRSSAGEGRVVRLRGLTGQVLIEEED